MLTSHLDNLWVIIPWTAIERRICKMACPFSSSRFKSTNRDSSREGDHRRITKIRQDEPGKPSRQSSVQITSSLLGEDGDDLEDTQTLNLKHLRAAVTLLTNPSVLNKRRFYSFSFHYRRIHKPPLFSLQRALLSLCSTQTACTSISISC